jgi:hypothetical protein
MAGEFKLTFNPKVEAANKVKEGIKGKVVKPIVKTPPVKAQSFMQQMVDKIKNMPKPKVPGGAAITKAGSAVAGAVKSTAIPSAAATVGVIGATKLAESAGRPGQSRMSMFGADFKGDAPVYSTPLNSTPQKRDRSDLRGSETPGSSTPAPTNAGEGRAMDAADKHRPGAGYPAGVVRPMDYETNPGQVQPNLGSGSDGSEPRTTPEGLLSYGRDLSSLNQFTKDFTGGYELTDIKSSFQSEALPATAAGLLQLDKPFIPGANPTQEPNVSSTDEPSLPYGTQLPEGTKPFASTTPYKTGGNPNDPQDGTSDKPDRADNIRQVRAARLGRGVNGADFSGDEPDNSSLASPMYANSKRNAIRSTFLDHEGSSVQAIAAANAVAGYGKDSDANARFNYGGELVYAKDGMQQKAKNAAMMGKDPTEFLNIKLKEVKETK